MLACGSEQKIIKPNMCEIEPPRLGHVGKFDLTLITRCNLNPKQNLSALNISKLFDEEETEFDETEADETEDLTKLLLAQLVQSQVEIIKLKKPLWVVAILLGVLVLSVWF